jgi:acetyl esterase
VGLATHMVRDPDAEALVAQMRSLGQPALWRRGAEGARAYLEERAAAGPPGPPVESVEDRSIDAGDRSIPVRVYRPPSSVALPVVVYFHGGGWVVGSVAASDAFVRRLVDAVPCVLVSVAYRLAPEHPFPAAVEDAVVAVEWAWRQAGSLNADAGRLVVLGDSAGGNLATVAVRRLLDSGRDIVARQILAYPGVSAERSARQSPHGSEWPLTEADRQWFIEQYVPDASRRSDPDVAPLLGDVSGMPPTTLLLGGCDPVLDEGLAYAEKLWTAGNSVDLHLYAGQIHGFLTFDETVLPRSREALGVVANAVRNL